MSDTAYCYHCGRPHPKTEMRQLRTKGGSRRWRCIESIRATKRSVAERDAFGRQVTAMNSNKQSIIAKASQNPELHRAA